MACTDQQQIRHHCYAKGLLDPSLFPTDVVLAQPEVGLQRAIALFYWPPSLLCTYHLSRDPLVQIGPQDFRLVRAQVTPAFPQNHRDVTDVPQTQAFAKNPDGVAARGSREAGHPNTLRICARHMGHQVFARLSLDGLPWPGDSADKAPPTGSLVGVALVDHLAIGLGARGRGAFHDDRGRPCGRGKRRDHLTEQPIFCVGLRMVFRSNEAKGPRQARPIPVDKQQGETDAEKPGMRLAFPAFLCQGILEAPRGFVTPVAHNRKETVLGWWQGVQGFLSPPCPTQVEIPVSRFAHATKAPSRARDRGPAGEFFPGFPPWEKGLHANKPTEHEAVATFPHAGHPAKQDRDEKGQVRDKDQSMQRHERGMGDKESSIPGLHCLTLPLLP
jgi:hypothetical protein